jgi:hypothetical protein
MSLLSYFFLWTVLISLVGGVLSWRIWVYFQSQLYGDVDQPDKVHRRVLFTQGVMLLFGLGFLVSLGGFFLGRSDPTLGPEIVQPSSEPTVVDSVVETPVEGNVAAIERLPSTPTSAAEETPELEPEGVSAFALIANTNGLGVNVRAEPGLQGAVLTALSDGTEVRLLAGRESVDGFVWQEIEMVDGRRGWMANNFLLSVER